VVLEEVLSSHLFFIRDKFSRNKKIFILSLSENSVYLVDSGYADKEVITIYK
jgi:hypothetical protein